MSSLWGWVAVAGAGALHGVNPAAGWMLAAGWGVRTGDRRGALRALVPIATGHAASVAVVATAVALGHSMAALARPVMGVAAVLFLAFLFLAFLCRGLVGRPQPGAAPDTPHTPRTPHTLHANGRFCIALWSFVASTAHGSGMMLVPALVPLCLGDSPARDITASGSLPLALAAVVVHTLSMLGTQALVASGTVLGVVQARRRCVHHSPGGRDESPGLGVGHP